jgi:hypothetical protein
VSTVTAIEPKGDKAAILVMDDGSRVWTPEKAMAGDLVGKPIPSNWTQKTGDYGPQAFPPRPAKGPPGGRPTRWADTEDGARWMDGRINRRRALELAVQLAVKEDVERPPSDPWIVGVASHFYTFLNVDSPSGGGDPVVPGKEQRGTTARREGSGSSSTTQGKLPAAQAPRTTDDASAPNTGQHPTEAPRRVSSTTLNDDDCPHDFETSKARKGWDRCKLCGAYKEAA